MRVSDSGNRVDAVGSSHELAGADELISDLAALLDAGLVVVHEHVLGPARYGVAPIAEHREERPHPAGVAPITDHRKQRPPRVRARQPALIGGAILD